MRTTNKASAPNMEVLRLMWIESVLATHGIVSKGQVMDKFRCSGTCASHSLEKYATTVNPEGATGRDNVSVREGFAKVLTAELSNEAVMQFVNVMAQSARTIKV